MVRIGQGFDVHPFIAGRKLLLGGIEIPHAFGLLGHSDADVVLHAICDALLGAAGLGDIGEHFSDQDPQHKNADSQLFLSSVYQQLSEKGFRVNNLDITIIAEQPKISPYKIAIQACIAKHLKVNPSQVNIKATTCEKMGFIGRSEGIAAMAVVLLETGKTES